MAKDIPVETETEEAPSMEETAAAAYETALARDSEPTESEEAETEIEAVPEKAAKAKPPARAADGKFAAADGAVKDTETTDTALEEGGEAATPIVAPPSMSAAEKAEFGKLPPAMQAFVARRESDVERGLSQKTQALAEKTRRYDSLDQVLSPRRRQFAMMGVSEAQAIDQLLALSDFATNDIAGFLKYMAQNRGVDLRTLTEQPGAQAVPVDPALAATQQSVQELQRTIRSITSGQEQAQQQQINSEIEAFRTAKATDGNPAHPHFDAVRVAMGALMQSGQAEDIQAAYDMAVHANPTTRAQLYAEQRHADERARQAKTKATVTAAKQAQGTVLTPKGTTPGKPKAKTMEETAREAYDRINGAAA